MSRTLNQSNGRGNPLLERTASSPVVNMAPTLRPETVPVSSHLSVFKVFMYIFKLYKCTL
ncbi:unnamed protein product [Trichobilharzia regenti]|nr:unnamed protein product [Trichobilharzia regenti]